ncbi:MAG: ATP-binding protein [Xanthomonadales bacterium]|nr:ATP-binding protein [Xanthomonadales bacterium]
MLARREAERLPERPFRPKTVADRLVYPLVRRLRTPFPPDADLALELERLAIPELQRARAGETAIGWRQAGGDERARLLVAAPLDGGRRILLLEQVQDTHLLFAQRALVFLLAATLFAFMLTVLSMLAFAGVVSHRIRRLRNAVERALESRGGEPFAVSRARDEIGDLSRSFKRLMDEIAAYADYLRTLASKLGHELKTPLAIVRSSLENLEGEALPEGARAYLLRAREGAERLGAILRAMSEATRIERAIEQAEGEWFDLAELVRGCALGYRDLLAPDKRLELAVPEGRLMLFGAPDLVAQALDKLFDNAAGFCPSGGAIRIVLEPRREGARLAMENDGPPLPEGAGQRLFESLVSLRERAGEGESHLGLGLYIVRLVAEAHGGSVRAENREGGGVRFSMRLRRLGSPEGAR